MDDPRLLRLSPEDNVAAVTTTIEAGETVTIQGQPVTMLDRAAHRQRTCTRRTFSTGRSGSILFAV